MPAPTLYNLAVFFTIFAPPILAMTLLMAATMSGQTAVGFLYIIGYIFIYAIIWPLTSHLFKIPLPIGSRAALCTIFNMPFYNNAWAAPAFYMMIYAYSFMYVLFPNWTNKTAVGGKSPKLFFIIIMSTLMVFTIYVRGCVLKCLPTHIGWLITSVFLGLAVGAVWGILMAIAAKSFISTGGWSFSSYPGQESNRLKCSQPTTKSQVCTILKDGIPVGTL